MLKPNIDLKGRFIRFMMACLILGAGIWRYKEEGFSWLVILLLVMGLFVTFEAARAWCVVRACGMKTKY